MKVLWLASWYPNTNNRLDGDFIERHAEAASLFHDIYVIHVAKLNKTGARKVVKEEKKYSASLSAVIYYYPSYKHWGKFADVVISNYWFLILHFKAYRAYVKQSGKPDGVMAFVGLKSGIIALFFKYLYRIKFILFERWTGLLKEASPNFLDISFFKRWWWKRVISGSEKLATVSAYFALSINENHYKKEWVVIPNTVKDHFIPGPKIHSQDEFQFIHVSNMDHQKNFEDVLRAASILSRKKIVFNIVVYGPASDEIRQLTADLGLTTVVRYYGEVTHQEIAMAMSRSDVLILYSRFETFGNVIIEAGACGLPVIVSDHPVFNEIVSEGVTGIIAKGEDPVALAEKMEWIMNNFSSFDAGAISSLIRQKYNEHVIGAKFSDLFNATFKK